MATAEHVPANPAVRVSPEILDRMPPQNLDAERGVVGSLLLDANMCDEVATILRDEDFYADAHQKLFRHMMAMHDEGTRIDMLLLVERLKREGDFEAVGGLDLYDLAIIEPDTSGGH